MSPNQFKFLIKLLLNQDYLQYYQIILNRIQRLLCRLLDINAFVQYPSDLARYEMCMLSVVCCVDVQNLPGGQGFPLEKPYARLWRVKVQRRKKVKRKTIEFLHSFIDFKC